MADGARVVGRLTSTTRGSRALVAELGVDAVPVADVLTTPADVLAPCALGGVLTRASVDALACEIVCGGANNQLATVEIDDALAARGVLYAPGLRRERGRDPEHRRGVRRATRAPARSTAARGIEATMARIFAAAREWGVAPGRAADRIARERIAHEPFGAGRWEPGDPAAWTDGAPLRTLRPARSDERGHHVAGDEQEPGEEVESDVGLHRRHERVRLVVARARSRGTPTGPSAR